MTSTTDLADDADALPTSDVMGEPVRATAAMSATGRAGPGGQQATNPIAKTTTGMDDKPKNLVDSGIDLKTPLTQAEAAKQIGKLLQALQGKREGLWLKTYPDSLYSEDAPNITMQFYVLQLLAIIQPQSFTPELQQLLARFNPQNPAATIQAIIQQPALAATLNASVEKLTAPITPSTTSSRATEPMVQTRSGRMITVGQLQDILGRQAARREHMAQQRRPRRPRPLLRQGAPRLRRPRRMIKPVEELAQPKTVELVAPIDFTRQVESDRTINTANDDRKTPTAKVRQPLTLSRGLVDLYQRAKAAVKSK